MSIKKSPSFISDFFQLIIMKKTNFILPLGALIMFLLSACHSEQNAVETAAYGYLDAMGNYRIKDAEAFATPATIESTLHVIEEVIMPNTDTDYIKSNTPASIEITEVIMGNDTTATVKYKKTTPIKVQEGELKLVKQSGKWLAEVFIVIPQALSLPQKYEKNTQRKNIDTLKLKAVPMSPTQKKK